MRTIAETFLDLLGAGTAGERARGDAGHDLLTTFDAACQAYLAQRDLPASDAALAPSLFDALRALLSSPSTAVMPAAVRAADPPQAAGSSPLLLAAAPILAGVLIASITLGTLSLSIVLTVGLALLAWLGGGGRVFGLALPTRAAAPVVRSDPPRAVTRMPSLARLEAAFRQADALLVLARAERPSLPTPSLDSTLDQGHLQFLQDLAEAGAAQDGEHLVKLVSRRLPSIAQGQDLRFANFEHAPDCFVIDEASEPGRRGTTETLRPAILRGDRCMARGYARRYV